MDCLANLFCCVNFGCCFLNYSGCNTEGYCVPYLLRILVVLKFCSFTVVDKVVEGAAVSQVAISLAASLSKSSSLNSQSEFVAVSCSSSLVSVALISIVDFFVLSTTVLFKCLWMNSAFSCHCWYSSAAARRNNWLFSWSPSWVLCKHPLSG